MMHWLGIAALALSVLAGVGMCFANQRKSIFLALLAQSLSLCIGAYWIAADDSAIYLLAAFLIYDAVVLFYLQSQEILKFGSMPLDKKEKVFLAFTLSNAFVVFYFAGKKIFQLQKTEMDSSLNLLSVVGSELQNNSSYLYPLAAAWLAAACVCALLLVRSGKGEK